MPIHYVDTYEGSDANDGSSWAQAWESCYPLKALYGGLGSVSNLEVRFAKTPPVGSGVQLFSTPSNNRPVQGYLKPAIPGALTSYSTIYEWGGTPIAPFTSTGGEGSSSPYRPAGTYTFRIDIPVGADGFAARWALADGDFSTFQCFETIAAFYFRNSDEPCAAEAWLEFSTDVAGADIVWSRKIEAGKTAFEARMCLLGNNDLPSNASYAFLRIRNQTGALAYFDCSGANAVLPPDHPQYVGYRLLYAPVGNMGGVFAPSVFYKSSGSLQMGLTGRDGPGVDRARAALSVPPRTWDIYRWVPFPYAPEPLFPVCSVAGSATTPLKAIGGWNKDTNIVDGLTALDAANLRWFSGVRLASVDVRNLAITFRRTGRINSLETTPGIMEYAGYFIGTKQLSKCYAERVLISGSGPGCVGESIATYISSFVRESLLSVPEFGISAGSSASFRHCNTFFSTPFGGGVDYEIVEDSAWSTDMIRTRDRRTFRVRRCLLINPRWAPGTGGNDFDGPGAASFAPTYEDCDIVQLGVENSYGNEFASAPQGWLENCKLWGPYTGPTSHKYASKNLQYIPIPGMPGPVCVSGADIDGLSIAINDATVFSNESMFARTSFLSSPVKVSLKNSNLPMIFSEFVPASVSQDHIGHTVELDTVTLHKTNASVGAPFKSSRLRAKSLTMSGAWSAVQEGVVRMTEIDKLILTDADTKIVNNFRFVGPAAGWGRVCATYRNIVQPLGLAGFLGAPAQGYGAGAAWFHTLDGEMWATHVMTVTRDVAVAHSGLTSWKLSALQPIGAVSAGSFMVGTIPVTPGVPVTFSAMLRRSSGDALGGIFIRPAATRAFPAPSAINPPSLHDVVTMQDASLPPGQWELVTVTYTPFRAGLVELHAGRRGMPGTYVWLDSLKVTQ